MYFNNNNNGNSGNSSSNNNKCNSNMQNQVSNTWPAQETAQGRLHADDNGIGNNSGGQMLVDDLTIRLDQMNVDLLPVRNNVTVDHQNGNHMYQDSSHQQQLDREVSFQIDQEPYERNVGQQLMSIDDNDLDRNVQQALKINNNEQLSSKIGAFSDANGNNGRNILIVTNLDSSVFSDKLIKAKFESLFMAYDANVTFRYLKSFRRVRLDFSSAQMAEQARFNLNNFKLGDTIFKCYLAQIIKPNFDKNTSLNDQDSPESEYSSNSYLRLPKPTKQFLISPPASPPVDWEPVHEGSPCIDVQLISALANLVPGKMHEIHPGNESQPGIFVEICEETRFEGSQTRRIPKTASPSVTRS